MMVLELKLISPTHVTGRVSGAEPLQINCYAL